MNNTQLVEDMERIGMNNTKLVEDMEGLAWIIPKW